MAGGWTGGDRNFEVISYHRPAQEEEGRDKSPMALFPVQIGSREEAELNWLSGQFASLSLVVSLL